MAAKKKVSRGPRSGGPNKSDFIRANPNLSPVELIAKAKESGFSVSPVLIYKVRSRAKGAKPAARGRKAGGKLSASDFVRSKPLTMKASEIVAEGKAKGIKLSPTLVYMVRKADATRQAGGGKPGRRGPESAARLGGAGNLSAFKRLALDLGIANARQALDELERGLAALVG